MKRRREADRYADVVGIPQEVRRVALDHLAMVGDEGRWLITAENPRTVRMVLRVLSSWAARLGETIRAVEQEFLAGDVAGLRLRAYLTKAGRIPVAPGWGAVPEVALSRVESATVLSGSPPEGGVDGPGVAQAASKAEGGGPTPTTGQKPAQGPKSAQAVLVTIGVTDGSGGAQAASKTEGSGPTPTTGPKSAPNGLATVKPIYLLKALGLAGKPDGVRVCGLAEAAGVTPRHGRRILAALAATGTLTRAIGPVPHKRSPGRAPLVYRTPGGAARE